MTRNLRPVLVLLVLLPTGCGKQETSSASAPEVSKEQLVRLRKASRDNLKQIGIGFQKYEDTNTTFPPAAICGKDGKPLLSWRVAILPFIGQEKLFNEFKADEPWDSVDNKKLLARMPSVYRLPGSDSEEQTFYRTFVGPGGLYDEYKTIRTKQVISFSHGLSNTIFVVEAGESVPWTKPDELIVDPNKPLPKLGKLSDAQFTVLMGDGTVFGVSNKLPEKTLRMAINPLDPNPLPDGFWKSLPTLHSD